LTLRDRLAGSASVLGIAASLWGPTYWLAGRFGYHAALGGWTVLGVPLYWPGQLIPWAMTWGSVYQATFLPAGAAMLLESIKFRGVLGVGPCWYRQVGWTSSAI
jgi:hypothetical protein